ncbi:MAG: N-6 DNA methylase [Bacteroides sp.]|nr:N-6 DNA methylase [Bacteroides sp.]
MKLNTASDVHVFNQDFFQWFKENKTSKYDAVLANPPYIRHQYLSSAQKEIQTEILTNNNLKSNRLINSWVAFVIASINLLKNEGKIALVIPSDILQVSYAKDLRSFLIKELSELNLITFKGIVFPDTEQNWELRGCKKQNLNTL